MSGPIQTASPPLRKTPLHAAHVERGARMAAFAGYDMPIQYPTGIVEEHLWTRTQAGLFDISHMGQANIIAADGRDETAAQAIEALLPADIIGLKPGQQRYSQLTNATGGVIDDLIVTRPADPGEAGTLQLVLNAARKDVDSAHIASHLGKGIRLEPQPDLALIALQGPKAETALASVCPEVRQLPFMHAMRAKFGSYPCHISRSGYTGEDGFEISMAAGHAADVWQRLLQSEWVKPCGLGARDSLRLEAGLCLYGHELDETTSPVEAGLAWSIQKRRRTEGGFPGAERILRELSDGPGRLRVGILPGGRAPAREGTEILAMDGTALGRVTSGGYSPTLKRPIAIGLVPPANSKINEPVKLLVRGAPLDARIVALPFVPHTYRKSK